MKDAMNETTQTDDVRSVPWPTSGQPARLADTSMLPDGDDARPDLLASAALGAHDTVDRLVDSAAPALEQMAESLSSAGQALEATAGEVRALGDEWAAGVRSAVREHPLLAVAAALSLGVVIARIALLAR